MSASKTASQAAIVYPEDDGLPMADNTKQLRWIVRLYDFLCGRFRERDDVFVAANLLWYPIEGDAATRYAPDALVAFGRPKGDRSSYRQWEEDGVAPQVVFEVLSPSNTVSEMRRKRDFYEQYGVDEYYVYDPDDPYLEVWTREGDVLRQRRVKNAVWKSPLLGVNFDMTSGELRIVDESGKPYRDYPDVIAGERAERERADAERRRAEAERQKAVAEHARAERLAKRLRDLGIDPEEETR